MSEQRGSNDNFGTLLVIMAIIIVVIVMAVKYKTDIRNLQRRVGELESRAK